MSTPPSRARSSRRRRPHREEEDDSLVSSPERSPQRTPRNGSTTTPTPTTPAPTTPTANATATEMEEESPIGMDDEEMETMMESLTKTVSDSLKNENTRKAYEYKIKEYLSFCRIHRAYLPAGSQFLVDEPGTFYFIFYNVFREKTKGKRKKPGDFDYADFKHVIRTYKPIINLLKHSPGAKIPPGNLDPTNPLSESTINTYRSALKHQWDTQGSKKDGERVWSDVDSPRVRSLVYIAKVRLTSELVTVCRLLTLSVHIISHNYYFYSHGLPVLRNVTTRRK